MKLERVQKIVSNGSKHDVKFAYIEALLEASNIIDEELKSYVPYSPEYEALWNVNKTIIDLVKKESGLE